MRQDPNERNRSDKPDSLRCRKYEWSRMFFTVSPALLVGTVEHAPSPPDAAAVCSRPESGGPPRRGRRAWRCREDRQSTTTKATPHRGRWIRIHLPVRHVLRTGAATDLHVEIPSTAISSHIACGNCACERGTVRPTSRIARSTGFMPSPWSCSSSSDRAMWGLRVDAPQLLEVKSPHAMR